MNLKKNNINSISILKNAHNVNGFFYVDNNKLSLSTKSTVSLKKKFIMRNNILPFRTEKRIQYGNKCLINFKQNTTQFNNNFYKNNDSFFSKNNYFIISLLYIKL